MEWLQTYKIGKHLLENGFEPVDAFFENYRAPEDKKPFILEIIVDIKKKEVSFNNVLLTLSENPLTSKRLKDDNFFSSVAGKFTNYNLTTRYKNVDSIKAFFEDRTIIKKRQNKKSGKEESKREYGGLEKEYEKLIEEELLDKDFGNEKKNPLVKWRNAIISDKAIFEKLQMAIDNIALFVEKYKLKEYDKKINPDEKGYDKKITNSNIQPLSSRLDLSKGADDIAYVTIAIVDGKNGKIYMSRYDEYREFSYNRFLLLSNIGKSTEDENGICYFTGNRKVYPIEMPRDTINILKVSTVTQKNYYSYFKGERFFISKYAYACLKLGAKYLSQNLVTRIAEIQHYIIPDFNQDFNLTKFKNEIDEKIDLAFQPSQYKKTRRRLDERISKQGLNSLTFIGFQKNDKQIDIINRIQTIAPDRYNLIIEELGKAKEFFLKTSYSKIIQGFSFSSIYYIIPERYKKDVNKKVPLKKSYTLGIFKCLFENTPVNYQFILEHYGRLIDIYWFGHPDSDKKYRGSLNITLYGNENNYRDLRDRAIENATVKYLILLKLIQKLYPNSYTMEPNQIDEPKTQEFFSEFGFKEPQRAMFYLGKLIRRVAETQKKQNHGHKPVLGKINYSGMKLPEIKRLKIEVLDKLRQYNSKKFQAFNFGEKDLKKFEYYFCKSENKWDLTEIENVFYLFSGYGMYWETIEPKEKQQLQEEGIEEGEFEEVISEVAENEKTPEETESN